MGFLAATASGMLIDELRRQRIENRVGAGMEGSVGQNISATDVLCEGPIYGLVNGQSSLYLDDNPAVDAKYH